MGKKKKNKSKLPKLGFLYLDYVMRFFDHSNFRGWPDKIEIVTYHWKNDKARFIKEVKRKKIDVLVGNIPATAYETFREIARELPNVRFIPSMDTQFSNKSKENVTRFCWKYDIPIPKTYIFYDRAKGYDFVAKAKYPKIIKKSYGPSNYGGYFVHKADSAQEAKKLFDTKKYHPMYIQDFVPMEADVRVMLIGHKPVCAFWRRAPEGEWLTNTSQGGSMDYMDVPKELLDLAVSVSKAANAEYWACDVAVGKDGKYRILECATAFAAFPYIRDWIGQYIMYLISDGKFKKPNIPLYNWEELGKIDSSLLRTMRYITFGKYSASFDGEYFMKKKRETSDGQEYIFDLDNRYPMLDVKERVEEEWPSEKYNFQDKYPLKSIKSMEVDIPKGADESALDLSKIKEEELYAFLTTSIKGIGDKKATQMLDKHGKKGLIELIENNPNTLLTIEGMNENIVKKLLEQWSRFKEMLKL
jgi:glutathione synthase/RimK-type ligase-like ATP-grasp enzyme/Txe/YoeB family toxin of Txe-Axe toxin-antitoxin module